MDLRTSVLMSVYIKENAEHLELALNSILSNQTKKPDEFVLVCDGPLTPELDNIIHVFEEKYNDRFFVYRIEQNQGLGKALNFGLSKCNNEIIIRADSDDVCDPKRIEIQYKYFVDHPDVSVVSSYIDEFDLDWKKPLNLKTLPLNSVELAKMAKFRNPINHMAAAFRKSVILSIGSYRHIPYVEDYELWVRTIINGYKLGNIDKVLVHARIGNGMVKRRGNKQYIVSWKELCLYMLRNHMINHFEYCRNMFAVRVFVYMPTGIKKAVYKTILRK